MVVQSRILNDRRNFFASFVSESFGTCVKYSEPSEQSGGFLCV